MPLPKTVSAKSYEFNESILTFLGLSLFHCLPDIFGTDRQFTKPDSDRILNRTGQGRRTRNDRRFPNSTDAEGTMRRGFFNQFDVNRRYFIGTEQSIIHKTWIQQKPLFIELHPLPHSPSKPLDDSAVDLPFDEHWIEGKPDILDGKIMQRNDFPGFRIDPDLDPVDGCCRSIFRKGTVTTPHHRAFTATG